ncbi:MAG: hypothetical protein CVV21_07255 [Candidatus Goldiibacteriota bacterium HGW-Goldbacteria-1]|jgi:hypothetical protein|nr:MAG: hypothetical protein CVV21_07255 [Candidatus Goldiibacteriota bacterium HGW-Goldbacteria-1]
MKALLISFLLILFTFNLSAYVYEKSNAAASADNFQQLIETGGIKARINGREMQISRYLTEESPDEIKKRIISGNVLSERINVDASFYGLVIGVLFPKESTKGYEVFFVEKGKDINITAISETENGCAVVIAVIKSNEYKNYESFYDDKIRHPKDIKKIASVELLDGDITINYFNLYETAAESAQSIMKEYKYGLKKDKWNITDISKKNKEVSILAEKENKQVYISADVNSDTGKYMIFVLG